MLRDLILAGGTKPLSGNTLDIGSVYSNPDRYIPDIPTTFLEPYSGGFYIGDYTSNGMVYGIVISPRSAEKSLSYKTSNTSTTPVDTTNSLLYTMSLTVDADMASLHPGANYCRSYGDKNWCLPDLALMDFINSKVSYYSAGLPTDFKTNNSYRADNFYMTASAYSADQYWARRFLSGPSNYAFYKRDQPSIVRPVKMLRRS